MAVGNLANMSLRLKKQSALGTPESGAGATGIDVTPSQGISLQVASIESALINTHRMRKRPRQGSRFVTNSYGTELQVGNITPVFEAILGGSFATPAALDETDLTSCAITDSGATVTFAGGSLITEGVRAGMWAKLTGMTEAENNGKWFPILAISSNGRVVTTVPGILTNESADSGFDIEFSPSLYTPDPYVDSLWTVEEYLSDLDVSKLGSDQRMGSLSFSCQPDSPIGIEFGMGGRKLDPIASASAPVFTAPTFTRGPSLVLLDGGIYVNGVKRANTTGLTWGLSAPITGLPVVDSVYSPDVFIGQFTFTGQVTAALENFDDFEAFDDEARISLLLKCAERGGTHTEKFVSFYFGDLAFGAWSTPMGGEGAVIQTMSLLGGVDERGGGFAQSTVVIAQVSTP